MDRPASLQSRRVELTQVEPFTLGRATFDPSAHEAIIGDRTEHLQPQTMKVLVALHERLGEVVSRDELVERCWDGRIVGDDVINRCVSVLRKLSADIGGFTIETVPKAGYRLVERGGPSRRSRWPWLLGAAIAFAGIGAFFLPRGEAPPRPPTIAMMAFTSGSDQQSRDLAAATSESLAHMLLAGTFVPRLDWPATARERSAADFVLSGDVRHIGGGYNVVVQMRDRATGTVMFSRHYRASLATAPSLPERIGAEMSSNISGALAMLVLDRGRPVDPEMAAEFLKQIAMIVQGQDPLDSYRVSLALADKYPDAALPQLALAFSTGFALGALPADQRMQAAARGRSAAQRALALAPHFGDAYYPSCMLRPQFRLRQCEAQMREGMKADPGAPYLPAFLSDYMLAVGRHEEALSLARSTLSDQPYQPQKLRRVIQLLLTLGYDGEAAKLYRRAIRWWPDHPAIHADYLHGWALRGDLAGLRNGIREMPATAAPANRAQLEPIVRAWAANDAPAMRKSCTAPALRRPAMLACIGGLQRFDEKYLALRLAAKLAPPLITGSADGDERAWLASPYDGVDPILAAPAMRWLRDDARYRGLIDRVGLATYWRSGKWPDFCKGAGEGVCRQLSRSGASPDRVPEPQSTGKNRLTSI